MGHDYNVSMSRITDVDRAVFSEAVNTVLDNFTNEDQEVIHRAASDLKRVFQAARKRHEANLSPIMPAKGPTGELT